MALKGYAAMIAEEIGTDHAGALVLIEDLMRQDRTGLDGLTPAEFRRVAVAAVVDAWELARAGELAFYVHALRLDVGDLRDATRAVVGAYMRLSREVVARAVAG